MISHIRLNDSGAEPQRSELQGTFERNDAQVDESSLIWVNLCGASRRKFTKCDENGGGGHSIAPKTTSANAASASP